MTNSAPRLAILFWYYKEPDICVDRVRLLRRLNPGIRIYGLYGGNLADFAAYQTALAPWLDHNWMFQGDLDAQWKWRHRDRLISLWYLDQGQHCDWDTLIVMQWDMLALAPVSEIFGALGHDQIYLPGYRRLDEIESKFYWTRPETEVYEDYLQFKTWIKAHYGFEGDMTACQFMTAALPRSFLDRYATMPQPELGFFEYKIPTCATLFGTQHHDLPNIYMHWFDSKSKERRRTLTTDKQDIPAATIAAETLTIGGARLFHPVTYAFPSSRAGLYSWLLRETAAVPRRKLRRVVSSIAARVERHLQKSAPPLVFPKARRKCDLVIIFAAANGEGLGIDDLLDSFQTYLTCDYEIVVADDATTDGTYERLLKAGCWVVRNPEPQYLWGLDVTLRRAFVEAHRLFDSPIYLKIDPDALVIGSGLESALTAAFKAYPGAGLLGAYHFNSLGQVRDLSYWKDRMLKVRTQLGKPLKLAIQNGYKVGDGVQGGAYAISRGCLDRLVGAGWLRGAEGYSPPTTKQHCVAEDSLITMLTYAAGFQVGEIGGAGQSFAVAAVGLPMQPDELVRQNRIVTHAMKYQDEASLLARTFFRSRRVKFKEEQHQKSS